jgi:hypothetical protein
MKMVKPIGWECEICGSLFESEEEAKECEEQKMKPSLFQPGDQIGAIKPIFAANCVLVPTGFRLAVLSVKAGRGCVGEKNRHVYHYVVEVYGRDSKNAGIKAEGWSEGEIEKEIELGFLKKI